MEADTEDEDEEEEEEVELLQPDSKPKPDTEASKDEGVDDSQSLEEESDVSSPVSEVDVECFTVGVDVLWLPDSGEFSRLRLVSSASEPLDPTEVRLRESAPSLKLSLNWLKRGCSKDFECDVPVLL